jgi:ferredoxin-NADP reductase
MAVFFHTGKIIRKFAASPTIMVLDLELPSFSSFEPGQWLDFVVPPHKWVGGFSIASSPTDLPRVRLAVKRSSHAPSIWVHEESSIDTPVQVRVGGSCVLDEKGETRPAVFCAGGIGISPVLGQYREYLTRRRAVNGTAKTSFLYSVSSEEELVFVDEILKLVASDEGNSQGLDRLTLTLTRQSEWKKDQGSDHPNVDFRTGRLLNSFLANASSDAVYYLCGPPGMLDDAVAQLEKRGIAPTDIRCERWW